MTASRAVWICPKCGARLVTRNLWHSCGQFTLEALVARSTPRVLALARATVRVLRALGDVQVLPQKTRLVAVARVRFAALYPRRDDLLLAFSLHRWIRSARIVRRADYGPRWRGHFVRVALAADLDRELRAWLQESHDVVGRQQGLPAARAKAAARTPVSGGAAGRRRSPASRRPGRAAR